MKHRIYIVTFSLFCILSLSMHILQAEPRESKTTELSYTFHFRINSSEIDLDFLDNRATLERMLSELAGIESDKSFIPDSLKIVSSSSPDGRYSHNDLLSRRRGVALLELLQRSHPHIDRYKLSLSHSPEYWSLLRKIVIKDKKFPNRSTIIDIIDDPFLSWDQKEIGLNCFKGSFRYLAENYIRELRVASATFTFIIQGISVPAMLPDDVLKPKASSVRREEQPLQAPDLSVYTGPRKRTAVAFRTNLLADALTAVNLGLEVPINENFSIYGSMMFPWWLTKDNRYCLQILSAGAEVRWWFRPEPRSASGKSVRRDALTGHFLGLYACRDFRHTVGQGSAEQPVQVCKRRTHIRL